MRTTGRRSRRKARVRLRHILQSCHLARLGKCGNGDKAQSGDEVNNNKRSSESDLESESESPLPPK